MLPVILFPALLAGALSSLWMLFPKPEKKAISKREAMVTGVITLVITAFVLALTPSSLALNPGPLSLYFLYATFISLLCALSYWDIKYQITPNEITLGGAALCFILALSVTAFSQGSLYEQAKFSILGTLAGAGCILLVRIFGKLGFGQKNLVFEEETKFRMDPLGNSFQMEDDTFPLENFFSEGGGTARITYTPHGSTEEKTILLSPSLLAKIDGAPVETPIEGILKTVVVPRDVVGTGDIKIMTLIGVVCGPTGALFSMFAGAIVGVFLSLPLKTANGRVPFGPFLAIGSLIWLTIGPEVLKRFGW